MQLWGFKFKQNILMNPILQFIDLDLSKVQEFFQYVYHVQLLIISTRRLY